jgi:mRNA interferase MazF
LIADDRPGAALADQVKSLYWVACKAQRKGRVSACELNEVRAKILALFGPGLQH